MGKAVKQFTQMEYKVGDVVHQKSGGPKMTVQKTDQWGVICTWFSEEKRLLQAQFPPDAIEKAKK